MAQQAKKKATRSARRSDVKGATDLASPEHASAASQVRLKTLEHERDEALRKLATAEQRIQELEGMQDQIVHRIDWVIDSLHNMKDDRA